MQKLGAGLHGNKTKEAAREHHIPYRTYIPGVMNGNTAVLFPTVMEAVWGPGG